MLAGATPKLEDTVTAADASIVQASVFHARPLSDKFAVVGAGRYGTLGLIIEALASNVMFRYWDYQSKLFYTPTPRDQVEVPFAKCNEEPFTGRLPPFWRIDARVQKREVYDTWYFDFYLDIMNVTFNREAVGYELTSDGRIEADRVLIFVPMLGLRAQL